MKRCEFCGSELPEYAGFCGTCGRVMNHVTNAPTGLQSLHSVPPEEMTARNPIDQDPLAGRQLTWQRGGPQGSGYNTIMGPSENENEEERRRRAALLGLAMPLASDALGNGPTIANMPMAQGTPQFGSVPTAQGTPQFGGGPSSPVSSGGFPGSGAPGGFASPPLVLPPPISPMPPRYPPPGSGGSPSPTGGSSGSSQPPPGCVTWLIVVILPLIILASIFGAGLTVFAPALSLSGSANVAPGGLLHLHGHSFMPGDSVSFTLDGSLPLSPSAFQAPQPLASLSGIVTQASSQPIMMVQSGRSLGASSTVIVNGNGTFDVTLSVGQDWRAGPHMIRASEGFSPRSATLPFTVLQAGQTPTPTPVVTVSPTSTPTVTPTATSTPTATPSSTGGPSGLSSVNPSSVILGPVSTGTSQPSTAQVTLGTTGSAQIPWTASWNANQASWLQINPASGMIQAPASQPITISALPGGLGAGNYAATVTFSSSNSNSVTLNVSLTIQAACITATPNALRFTGVAGKSDPPSQTVALNNCGLAGPWSSSITTDTGARWLSINPSSGSLDSGGNSTISVAASNIKSELPPGTYQGKITFTNGSAQAIVSVTLVVISQPILSVSPSSVNTSDPNTNCVLANSGYSCTVTLTSNRGTQLDLNWSVVASNSNITFSPASSGTIAPGKASQVTVLLPFGDCGTSMTLTFSGPANTVTVPASCSALIG